MTPSILLVEDDDDTARLIAELLEAASSPAFHVLTASSATEALGIVAGTPVDCVVLDYDLPDRNGLEFLPDIRRR